MAEDTQRITVGDVTVTAVVESEIPGIPVGLFYPGATAATVAAAPWLAEVAGAADEWGNIAFRVQAFVIERGGRTVLVDPCVGNGKQRAMPFWNDLALPWRERFEAAGFRTDDVDLVVHTHLHADHLGWDTHRVDGHWVPTFPRARHVYVDTELDWFAGEERNTTVEDPMADSVRPILDAGLADVVAIDADLGGGLRLLPTPGHTPGHVSLLVETAGDPLVVTGDALHHPFQCADIDVAEIADADAVAARRSRGELLDHCCRSGSLVAGTHFPVAPFGRVEVEGARWRYRPADATVVAS